MTTKQLFGLGILAILYSCGYSDLEFEKVQDLTLETEIAFPIGSISYTVKDLVDDIDDDVLEIEEDNDFFLSFIYRDTTVYNDHNELVTIGDIENSENYSPAPFDLPAVGTNEDLDYETDFDFVIEAFEGERIDSVFFSGGSLSLNITNHFDPNVTVDFTFTLTDVQDASSQAIVFQESGVSGNGEFNDSRSLTDLKAISMTNGMENIFQVNLFVTLHVPAGTVVKASDNFDITMNMTDPEFEAIFGDFGSEPISIVGDEIETSFFQEIGDGNIELSSPSITLYVDNSYGIEMGISLDGVSAVEGMNEIALTGDVVNSDQFIDAPNLNQIGQSIKSEILIDKTNSNLPDLLNSLPEKIIFDLTATANPAASDNLSNFLYDDQRAEIIAEVAIPFEFSMDGFTKEIDFETGASDISGAEEITLTLTSINEIPFTGSMDIAFKDENENDLHVIPNISLIESPSIGTDGRTTAPLVNEVDVVLDRTAIDAFLDSETAVVTLTIETMSAEAVKIFSDYKLDVELAISGKISLGQ